MFIRHPTAVLLTVLPSLGRKNNAVFSPAAKFKLAVAIRHQLAAPGPRSFPTCLMRLYNHNIMFIFPALQRSAVPCCFVARH